MYPGRLPWVALGSGEAVNECVAGGDWPAKPERNRRLLDGARAMRELLDGQRVSIAGPPAVVGGRLWCRPSERPRLVGAALSEDTARWLGSWAEGLLTVASDLQTAEKVIKAFREGGGTGRPVHLKLNLSWAPTEDQAQQQAHSQWRFNAAGAHANAELRQPEDFDQATRHLTHDDIRQQVFVSADLRAHVEQLRACAALGVESIDLHNVGLNQREFLDAFGAEVLPALRAAAGR
jgi:G6PDH family F420-dependent oxidoreductase